MDTDKSNMQQGFSQQGSSQAPMQPIPQQNPQQDIEKKKEKILKIKNFLTLKIKIHQLISLKKITEAKDTYYSLYTLYQDIVKEANEQEAAKFQSDLTSIYNQLTTSMKQQETAAAVTAHGGHSPRNQEEDKLMHHSVRRGVITTDFDLIVKTVEEKGKMSLADVMAQFKIGRRLAEEWIQILADYGLVEIKYLPVGGIEVLKINKI